MKIEQNKWSAKKGWKSVNVVESSQLVLGFGKREVFEQKNMYEEIKKMYPNAHILMGSSAGEILDTEVTDDTVVTTAVTFEKTQIKCFSTNTKDKDSKTVGEELALLFPTENLKHIFVLSEGSTINGTALLEGLNGVFGGKVSITGGLAGDGAQFQKTVVGLDMNPVPFQVGAIGMYGDALTVGYGSFGGWETFGAERKVTKSINNVLYELDGKPALELYKTYLGDKVAELPASSLLFPLCIVNENNANLSLTRTILTIDEENQSMTFAGDIPQGSNVKLMKSNHTKLVEGAEIATENCKNMMQEKSTSLAILVSCVGRKLVLGQRVEEEVEAVQEVLGKQAGIIGFYSYGELAPIMNGGDCYLHNQTMTVTLLHE